MAGFFGFATGATENESSLEAQNILQEIQRIGRSILVSDGLRIPSPQILLGLFLARASVIQTT